MTSMCNVVQDIPNFAALWAILHSELQAWLSYCKTKGREGKANYHLQALEALYEAEGNAAFSKVWVPRMLLR